MHLPLFFSLFGPVRSWWCFPFERLIGQIQRLLSNHKLGKVPILPFLHVQRLLQSWFSGQMESTLLNSFLQGAKLRRWLARPDCPPVFKEIKCTFDKIYVPKKSDDSSGNDNDTGGSSTAKAVPDDLRELLKTTNNSVFMRARLEHSGVIYSSATTQLGNSLIHFYPDGDRNFPSVPGCIKYIYSSNGINYYFAVQRQLPVHNESRDRFAHYLHFPAKTYSSLMSSLIERVAADWVFCHYA